MHCSLALFRLGMGIKWSLWVQQTITLCWWHTTHLHDIGQISDCLESDHMNHDHVTCHVLKFWHFFHVRKPIIMKDGWDSLQYLLFLSLCEGKVNPCVLIVEIYLKSLFESFLLHNDVLSPHQTSFKDKHSTATAVTNYIICALDKGKYCAALCGFTAEHTYCSDKDYWLVTGLSYKQQCVTPGPHRSSYLP